MERVFVVGSPRAGTTLLQSMLAAHPHVTSFTESHFFDKGFWDLGFGLFLRRGLEAARRLDSFVRENRLAVVGPLPRSSREIAALFVRIVDRAAKERASTMWVEKTPDHVFRIPMITTLIPDARFVHILRRAADVLPSLHRASREWGNAKTWIGCALHWGAATRASARYLGRPGHFFMIYERLALYPRDEMRRLIGWLGLEWDEQVVARQSASNDMIVSRGETWKAGIARPVAPSSSAVVAPALAVRVARLVGRYERVSAAVPGYETSSSSLASSGGAKD